MNRCFNKFCNLKYLNTLSVHRPVRQTGQTLRNLSKQTNRLDRSQAKPAQIRVFSPSQALALKQLDVVFHKEDTRICFPKFRFTIVNPTSPLRNSFGVSLFQLDLFSWVCFNHFPDSTILIFSTKRARSCPHRLSPAHHNVGN